MKRTAEKDGGAGQEARTSSRTCQPSLQLAVGATVSLSSVRQSVISRSRPALSAGGTIHCIVGKQASKQVGWLLEYTRSRLFR